MTSLEAFIESLRENPPDTIPARDISRLRPNPWVNRFGYGDEQRISLLLPRDLGFTYERDRGGDVWHRVERATEFDVMNEEAA
ncbi:MAG: hypothetical protein JHC95_15505 [Solirubrobacteraceae bacterium]|nr:hypothetical protein [Solirubrobacteraceae bacterium]